MWGPGRGHTCHPGLYPAGIGPSNGRFAPRPSAGSPGRASTPPWRRQSGTSSHESLTGQLWPDRFRRRLDPRTDHFQGCAIRHDRTDPVGDCQAARNAGLRSGHRSHPAPSPRRGTTASSPWRSPPSTPTGRSATTTRRSPPSTATGIGPSSPPGSLTFRECVKINALFPFRMNEKRAFFTKSPIFSKNLSRLSRNNRRKTLRIRRSPARPRN